VGAAASNRSAGFEVLAVMEKKEFKVDEPLILKLSMRNVARKALLAFESNPERLPTGCNGCNGKACCVD